MNIELSANKISHSLSIDTCKLLGTRNFHPYLNGLACDSLLGEIDINEHDEVCDVRINKLKLFNISLIELNECLQVQFHTRNR